MTTIAKLERRDLLKLSGIAGGGLMLGAYGGYSIADQMLAEGASDVAGLNAFVATVAHELGADLEELLPKYCQRPVFDLLRQRQSAQKVAEITGERRELKPDLVVAETMAA